MRRLLIAALMVVFSGAGVPVRADATITVVNSAAGSDMSGTDGSTIAASAVSHTTGNLVVAAVRFYSDTQAVTVSSVTDTAGNTYVKATGGFSGGDSLLDIWYAKNITGNASNVVTANLSAVAPYRMIQVVQYAGASKYNPYDVAASATGTSPTIGPSSAFTTTQAAEVIVAVGTINNITAVWTGDTGFTKEQDGVMGYTDKVVGTRQVAATVTMTNDKTNGGVIIIATFRAMMAAQNNPMIGGL